MIGSFPIEQETSIKMVKMNVEKPIKEIMTKKVIVVTTETPLHEIEEILATKPIHHLVVLNEGMVKGIISKNDILHIYRSVGLVDPNGMMSVKAKDIMVSDPMTVDPDDTIGLVSDIILANKFHSLPIVDDGELVGIVTSHDLIKYSYQ